ncbi:MAG TPA: hydroxymethylbilane synthase, partial [Aliarcobacter cryaerophilus]|nr:hydroxymethylbilane synthase [Aliarcobacter cryaerophilus]
MEKLVIATRRSQLALWQSEYIKAELLKHYPNMEVELQEFTTKGDKILDVPLAKIGGKGLFTKELEVAMLEGSAHLAVHSLKDVPTQFEDGLVLAAVSKRFNPQDALLSNKYKTIEELPKGAVVGTTSLRRRMAIKMLRPDIELKDLRGNINTRIAKLNAGEYDAIILAATGIEKLHLQNEVKYFTPISTDVMIPSMGQATLGIETTNDPKIIEIVKVLNDKDAQIESTIERGFVDTLQGGCQVPIGVKATIQDEKSVKISAIVGLPDGTEYIKDEKIID